MKITKKQNEEIDFICKFIGKGYVPDEKEKEIYVRKTVLGEKIPNDSSLPSGIGQGFSCKLEALKRNLDIQVKAWTEGFSEGWDCILEYEQDGYLDSHYGKKLFKSILNNGKKPAYNEIAQPIRFYNKTYRI